MSSDVLDDTVCNSMMSINTDVKWNDVCYCMNVEGKTTRQLFILR